MPCYMYINGMKQEMDEDLFDQMAETLHQSNNIHNLPTTTSTRWKQPEAILTTSRSRYKPDGTYDKKPLDPNYFSKYYQNKLSTPFTCPDCGRTITSKSNLSKHRQTNRCINSRCHWWTVELKHQSQKFQQATLTRKLLKEIAPYIV